jgi:hypothetical protein
MDPLPQNARSTFDANEVFRRLAKYHGVSAPTASGRLHRLKSANGRGPADNVLFDLTGNVYDPDTRAWLGNLTAGGGD